MSNQNYTLEIISHHAQFDGKSLRKYYVDGIETVGAWGNEPFEVRFKNNTWQKIQVKISVDGTDIFTGKPADTEVSKDMWVVNGYATLSLKAWPENNNGGAGFVFTSAENSVAIHTHGNLSSRGIIAAAVFTEGHVEPTRINDPHYHYHYNYPNYTYPNYTLGGIIGTYNVPTWTVTSQGNTGGISGNFGVLNNSVSSNTIDNNTFSSTLGNEGQNSATFDSLEEIGESQISSSVNPSGRRAKKPLESLVAVGAGQHVDQKITYVTGLTKPVFSETVRVKYVWWDDLVASLRNNNVPVDHPSGFPGDGEKHNHINLRGTPRLPKHGCFTRSTQPVYQRV